MSVHASRVEGFVAAEGERRGGQDGGVEEE